MLQSISFGYKGAHSDARLQRYLIRGLREEFMPFISSV